MSAAGQEGPCLPVRETTVLAADEVVAGYPGFGPVLRGASLTVTAGARLALLGANGSGKTTLLRCLSGAHRLASGRIRRGPVTLDATKRRSLREHRAAVQLVLQDPDDQLFSADVRQDVSFGPMNLGLPLDEVRARVDEALALLDATHLADRPTHRLSYGERKRVSTAGAVAMRPSVVLLDEPTAGLDDRGVMGFLTALERLRQKGTTVVVTTHDVDFALAWAEEVALVGRGQVVQGTATAVLGDFPLLARHSLRRPWPLELAARLELAGHPRDVDEAVALVRAQWARCPEPSDCGALP